MPLDPSLLATVRAYKCMTDLKTALLETSKALRDLGPTAIQATNSVVFLTELYCAVVKNPTDSSLSNALGNLAIEHIENDERRAILLALMALSNNK